MLSSTVQTSSEVCSLVCVVVVQLIALHIQTGRAISCFECFSVDGSEVDCEDEFAPYNQTGHLYRRDCVVGVLGFEAFYCIKIKGVKTDGQAVLIRTCSTTDWGSQCGDIFFEQGDVMERLHGCLASCDYDGCNGAERLLGNRRSNCYAVAIGIAAVAAIRKSLSVLWG